MVLPIVKRLSIVLACIALVMLVLSTKASSSKEGKKIVSFSKTTRGINVHIKGSRTHSVELYLFNTDGKLVHKTKSKRQAIITLPQLKNGLYLYQCFDEDVQLTSGNLVVQKNSIDFY